MEKPEMVGAHYRITHVLRSAHSICSEACMLPRCKLNRWALGPNALLSYGPWQFDCFTYKCFHNKAYLANGLIELKPDMLVVCRRFGRVLRRVLELK